MNAPLPQGATESWTVDERAAVAPRSVGPAFPRAPVAHARPLRRRRRRGEREADKALHNHATERWMISYADFITLLFAFFVVMYAMSSVNESRYRVLSGVLSTAFSAGDASTGAPARHDEAMQPPPAPIAEAKVVAATPAEPPVAPADRAELKMTAERAEHMQQLARRVDERLQALVSDGRVRVTRGARGIAIEINAAILFDPSSADLMPASHEALRSVARVLEGFVEPLQIEGHTDDSPIANRAFRSNWELSAARASSVARFLVEEGIAPGRIGVAGYAQFRPLAANSDATSRARNRRVTLVVLSADDTRPREGAAPGEQQQH